jgi:6-phosphogluconolactonase
MTEQLVFVGTYTRPVPNAQARSEGIYVYRLDTQTGALTLVASALGHDNPAYLTLSADGRFLYSVAEMSEGVVKAFAVNPQTGALTELNAQPSHGGVACHLSLDRTGRWLMLANYGSGCISVYPVQADGRLGPATDHIEHHGSSVNAARQEKAHAHWIATDPSNQVVLVSDLGMDKIMLYRLDMAMGKLSPSDPPWVMVQPGSGPRHIAFHPDGQTVFLVNELDSTIDRFTLNEDGSLRHRQRVPTLPADFTGTSTCAAIRVSPHGRFVYASNRGHDSIVTYVIDPTSGDLSYVGHQATGGQKPREFNLDPSGQFLLAANQDSHTIVSFRIDQTSGKLTPTGHLAQLTSPVCIVFGETR